MALTGLLSDWLDSLPSITMTRPVLQRFIQYSPQNVSFSHGQWVNDT
jgi:hypothetical protein